MIKRTIEVSGPEASLSLRDGQIIVKRGDEQVGTFSAEDVGMLIVDTPTARYTHGTLIELLEHGAVVVLCGSDHLPTAFVASCTGNTLQTERLAAQLGATRPLKKRLWRQVVQQKVRNQAANLPEGSEERGDLLDLVKRVRSGDPDNVEAQAARLYWRRWLPTEGFRRGEQSEAPNNFLNYGYAVLRAAVARAISGAGLHPSVGIHHHNRYDAFCLADDLVEPLRPLVDRAARDIFLEGHEEINKETKTRLLALLLEPVLLAGAQGPLFVHLERMLASLVRCYAGETAKLDIPSLA
ncbi:MAG: type II CRISPR-associated endonuclease Cas1 [Verrucomicrobia bacterium]|nr:type II CRISPR-associated endonuclease Cas1 [Verrucomicrobiota bacterium]